MTLSFGKTTQECVHIPVLWMALERHKLAKKDKELGLQLPLQLTPFLYKLFANPDLFPFIWDSEVFQTSLVNTFGLPWANLVSLSQFVLGYGATPLSCQDILPYLNKPLWEAYRANIYEIPSTNSTGSASKQKRKDKVDRQGPKTPYLNSADLQLAAFEAVMAKYGYSFLTFVFIIAQWVVLIYARNGLTGFKTVNNHPRIPGYVFHIPRIIASNASLAMRNAYSLLTEWIQKIKRLENEGYLLHLAQQIMVLPVRTYIEPLDIDIIVEEVSCLYYDDAEFFSTLQRDISQIPLGTDCDPEASEWISLEANQRYSLEELSSKGQYSVCFKAYNPISPLKEPDISDSQDTDNVLPQSSMDQNSGSNPAGQRKLPELSGLNMASSSSQPINDGQRDDCASTSRCEYPPSLDSFPDRAAFEAATKEYIAQFYSTMWDYYCTEAYRQKRQLIDNQHSQPSQSHPIANRPLRTTPLQDEEYQLPGSIKVFMDLLPVGACRAVLQDLNRWGWIQQSTLDSFDIAGISSSMAKDALDTLPPETNIILQNALVDAGVRGVDRHPVPAPHSSRYFKQTVTRLAFQPATGDCVTPRVDLAYLQKLKSSVPQTHFDSADEPAYNARPAVWQSRHINDDDNYLPSNNPTQRCQAYWLSVQTGYHPCESVMVGTHMCGKDLCIDHFQIMGVEHGCATHVDLFYIKDLSVYDCTGRLICVLPKPFLLDYGSPLPPDAFTYAYEQLSTADIERVIDFQLQQQKVPVPTQRDSPSVSTGVRDNPLNRSALLPSLPVAMDTDRGTPTPPALASTGDAVVVDPTLQQPDTSSGVTSKPTVLPTDGFPVILPENVPHFVIPTEYIPTSFPMRGEDECVKISKDQYQQMVALSAPIITTWQTPFVGTKEPGVEIPFCILAKPNWCASLSKYTQQQLFKQVYQTAVCGKLVLDPFDKEPREGILAYFLILLYSSPKDFIWKPSVQIESIRELLRKLNFASDHWPYYKHVVDKETKKTSASGEPITVCRFSFLSYTVQATGEGIENALFPCYS